MHDVLPRRYARHVWNMLAAAPLHRRSVSASTRGLTSAWVPWLLTLVGCHRGGTERVGLVHDADESKGQEARNSSALSVPAWMVVRWGQGLRRRTPVRVRFGRTVLRWQAFCSLVVRGTG